MWLFTFLKSQDYLGRKFGFRINSSDSHQTVLGGALSLFITSLYIYFFLNFSENMIKKKSPAGYSQLKPNTGNQKEKSISNIFLVLDFK